MLFGEMINKLRTNTTFEIRDEDNNKICIVESNSKGVNPYLDCEVVQWFIYARALFDSQPDACVLLKEVRT